MRRAGRVSPLLLLVVLGVLALGAILFMGKEGPRPAGARFMSALAKGDVDGLVKESYAPGKSEGELREDWKFATEVAKHYLFKWTITSADVQSEDSAVVRLQVERNYGPGSYGENYQLPLHLIDGRWKVDASGISREMYPALPRSGGDAKPAGVAKIESPKLLRFGNEPKP